MPKITDLATRNKIYNGDIVEILTIDNGEMFAIVRQTNGVFLKCPIDALSEYLPIKNKKDELEHKIQHLEAVIWSMAISLRELSQNAESLKDHLGYQNTQVTESLLNILSNVVSVEQLMSYNEPEE